MANPTLTWMNLTAYNLLAQVAEDKSGNSVLLLRPSNPQEDPATSAKRAELLQAKLASVVNQVGPQKLGTRVLQDTINVLMGPMVNTPAKMSRFLQQVFPKATPLELTADQIRQYDFIRQEAQKVAKADQITADSMVNLDALNDALPGDLYFKDTQSEGEQAVISLHAEGIPTPLSVFTLPSGLNRTPNSLVWDVIEEPVSDAINQWKTTDREQIQLRVRAIQEQLDNQNLNFWESKLLGLEHDVLETWMTETTTDDLPAEPESDDQIYSLDDLKDIRDALQERLDAQGYVLDDRLVKRLEGVKNAISEMEAETELADSPDAGEQPSLDNVQHNEGFEGEGVIGYTFAGETLYADENGVRYKLSGDFRITEKVKVMPGRSGVDVSPADRDIEWQTFDEAMEYSGRTLTLAHRIRALFTMQHGQPDANDRAWKGMVVRHKGEVNTLAVRAAKEEGQLQVAHLYVDNRYGENASPALQTSLILVMGEGDDRVIVEQPGRRADKATLKTWASLGLSLPTGTPEDAINQFEDIKSELDYEEFEENQHGQRDTDEPEDRAEGREDADRTGDERGERAAADAGGDADGLSAGGRSGGLPGSGGELAGGNGPDVPASVADGGASGESSGGRIDQGGERGDTEGGDGAARDQQGETVHAGLAVQGSGGGRGNGPDTGAGSTTGTGNDSAGETGLAGGHGDSASVSGQPDQAPEGALDEESAADRGAGRPGGSSSGVSDEADGEPERDGTTGAGAVPGTGGPAGSTAGQPADADSPRPDQQDTGSEVPAGAGSSADADTDGDGSGASTGGSDRGNRGELEPAVRDEVLESLSRQPELEQRSASERLKDNLAALRLLNELRGDGQDTASDEDREILAKYSGFGGIHPKMFRAAYGAPQEVRDATAEIWDLAHKGNLTSSEIDRLMGTILNAHYTHSGIIEPMWEAIDRMGLNIDRVLEPSCGIGNFRTYMPESVRAKVKNFTGVEYDSLTAELAKLVHKNDTIIHSGFEKTQFPDGFFDTAISNVPFGDYKVFDPSHPERKQSIHNQFFLKGLDKVRPGGVVAFVTSRYVMDSKDNSVRKEIMDQAHVMGAYRLPRQAFDQSTGTQVVTDILFLQKKGDFQPNYQPLDILDTQAVSAEVHGSSIEWDGTYYEPGDVVPQFADINGLYAREPERVLGNLRAVTGQFRPEISVFSDTDTDIASQKARISEAFASLPANVTDAQYQTVTAQEIFNATEKNTKSAVDLGKLPGALSVGLDNSIKVLERDDNGNVVTVTNTSFPKNMQKRAAAVILAMEGLSELLDMETSGEFDDDILDDRRAEVRSAFDKWETLEQKTKAAFSKKAWREITNDPRAQRMRFAEIYNEETREITRPDILFGRTVRPVNDIPTSADTLEDALGLSLAYTAQVSETYIAKLLSNDERTVTTAEAREQLLGKGLAFLDPKSNRLIERSVYLGGNLRPKIDACEAIVQSAPEYQRNLDALNEALPKPLTASQIKVGIDAFWIPQSDMEAFLRDELGISTTGNLGVKPYFDDYKRHWRMQPSATSGNPSMASLARAQEQVLQTRWGTKRRHGLDLLDNLFTNTIPKVMDPIPYTEPTRYKINTEETLKAQAKAEEIQDAFSRWVFKDPARTKRLVDIYNQRFNTTVLYEPDGSHMKFPGMAETWVPRKHQADMIWRTVSGPNAMTAHRVGAGKTLQLIGTAIRGKQLGRWNKPLVVVPNHMLEQFANDGQSIYPNAKILVMSSADARAVNRPGFAAKMALGDWDMVVCTHSVFEKITVPQEFEAELLEKEIARLDAALDNEDANKTPKEIEKAKKRLEERLERTLDSINRGSENVLNMEEIGVDWIGVDEAHYYKNLMPDTSQQIPGVSNASSKRAMNMLLKTQYLNHIHQGPYGVMMATGTPISNSVAELYTFTRMLRPDLLEENEILNFNDWMGLFGQIKHGMEMKPEGGGYQMKSRLSRFKNLPELIKMIRTFIDVKTAEDLNLPTPNVTHEQVSSEQSEFMELFMKYIEARAKGARSQGEGHGSVAEKLAFEIRHALYRANDKTAVTNSEDEVDPDAVEAPTDDILLTIATDGRKAALDPRLIHPKFVDDPNSKVNKAVRKMLELYQRYGEQKALQLMFCDFSSPTGKGIFNVYDDMKKKLIAGGVPEHEIAYIHDAKTDKDKEDLFAACRRGDKRFLFGSTDKMGVGTNVQERLVAMHQMDPPWKPSSIEQRLGRMDRQGNMFDEVYNFTYTTKDSFDLFMWETLNRKLQMVTQAMRRPEDCAREIEEDFEPGYEDILAITTGNPAIREFMDTRQQMEKLKRMMDSHIDSQADLGERIMQGEKKVANIDAFLKIKHEERDLVRENTPLAFTLDTPVPGLSDGPMSVVGGPKNIADVIEKMSEAAPAFRMSDIGTFGGLKVQVDRLGQGVKLSVQRYDGSSEGIYKLSLQEDIWEQGVHDEPVDHFREAAKTLIRYVRKIGNENGIPKTEEALEAAKKNLQDLKDDFGKPFAYEQDLEQCRKRFEELSKEVGDDLDENAQLDPMPLGRFIKAIQEQTGDHHHLVRLAKKELDVSGSLVRADETATASDGDQGPDQFEYIEEFDELDTLDDDWEEPEQMASSR